MLHAARLSTQMMGSVSDASFLQVPVPSTSRILVQSIFNSIFNFDTGAIEWGRYVTSRSC